ncbi:hypothetical protein [Streptomyces venezuelae]|uniref:hypothetical protein n=1 Tax=Streptomyces venezuelae TaxID=54571 RepID=UPI0037AF440C
MMVLVVEDACTQLAEEGWRQREPARHHPRRRRRWLAEGRQLEGKAVRVRELAVQCLDSPE